LACFQGAGNASRRLPIEIPYGRAQGHEKIFDCRRRIEGSEKTFAKMKLMSRDNVVSRARK
jgi:hypothetical protein